MRTLFALTLLASLQRAGSWSTQDAAMGVGPDVTRQNAPRDAAVAIRTFQFAPDTLRVRADTRVVWTNADDIEHTITSGAPDARDGHFHGVVATRGATFLAALGKPGTYRYFCDRHRFMNGTVIVTR